MTFFQEAQKATGDKEKPVERQAGKIFESMMGFVSASDRKDFSATWELSPQSVADGVLMVETFDKTIGVLFCVARISDNMFLTRGWLGEASKQSIKRLRAHTAAPTGSETASPPKWWQFWRRQTAIPTQRAQETCEPAETRELKGVPTSSLSEEVLHEDKTALDVSTFFEAVMDGDLRTVREFLENGMDPNNLEIGEPALLYASAMGNLQLACLLLEKGADPNISGKSGFFSIHFAVAKNQVNIVRLLLEHSAKVDPRNPNGYTPLYDAAAEGCFELASLLINHGADVSARGGDNSTPLHTAAFSGHPDLAELLLQKGASPFIKNDQGITALMAAGIRQDQETMRIIARQRMAEAVRGDIGKDSTVPVEARKSCQEAASLRQNWNEIGNLQRAEQLFREVVEKFPDCWMAHFGLGEILTVKINNEKLTIGPVVEEALAELKDACRLATGRREPQLKLAVEYAKTNILSAESVFRRAVDQCDNRQGCLYPIDWQAADYFSFAISAANSVETFGLSLEAFCRAIVLMPDYYGGEVMPANSLPAKIWTTALLVRPDGGKAIFEKPDILSPELRVAVEQARKEAEKPGQLHNDSLMEYERYLNTRDPEALQKALELEKEAWEISPEDFPERFKIAGHYGVLLRLRYDLDRQPDDLLQSVEWFNYNVSHVPESDPRRADCIDNLSIALFLLFEYNGDRAHLERGIDYLRQTISLIPALSPSRSHYLSNLGMRYLSRYKITSALPDLDTALKLLDQAVQQSDADTQGLPIFLTHRGIVRRNRFHRTADPQDLEKAIADFERAIQNTPETPKYTNDLAIRLNNLSNALQDRFKLSDNLTDLDRSIQYSRKALKINDIPGRRINYANALLARYRLTLSIQDLDQAIETQEIAIKSSDPQSPYFPSYLMNLGVALGEKYLCTNDHDTLGRAIDCLKRASELGKFIDTETSLQASKLWLEMAIHREAWLEAVEAYTQSANARERTLAMQVLREDKSLWLKETQRLPALGGYVFYKANRLQEAIQAVEAGRARLLGEALEQTRRDLERLPELGHGDLLEHYRTASQRCNALAHLASADDLPKSVPVNPDALLHQFETVQVEVKTVIAQIRQVPGYADFLLTHTAEQIRSMTQEATLAYLTLTPTAGLALIVDRKGIQALPLEMTETDLNARLTRSQSGQISGGYLQAMLGQASLQEALKDLLPWLGEKLIGPIAAACRPSDKKPGTITLIPTGHLALLPLHAALYTVDDTQRAFLDDFTVCYTPSAQMLSHARSALKQLDNQPKNFFGIGNPLPLPEGVKPLDFAEFEVKEIVPLFTAQNTLYRDEATLEAVEAHLPSCSHLHFSCHGLFDPEEPLKSGVVLANGEMLTLSDLMKGDQLSQARLAVLSACQTAITDFKKLPEEAIGLAAGFLQAGIPGVIGSLWPVDDLSTALVMGRFYHYHLRHAMEPAAALHEAQCWLRDVTAGELLAYFEQQKNVSGEAVAKGMMRFAWEDPEFCPYQEPYYWAPFVFFGV
jgi:CHAT domain-containing protein/ankyrin repeat protein